MQQDPEGNTFRLQRIMVSSCPVKTSPAGDELSEYTDGAGIPIYPVGKYPPNPRVCMIWDLVAQNGPMTGMRQIITLILR